MISPHRTCDFTWWSSQFYKQHLEAPWGPEVIWPVNRNSCTLSEFECNIGDILLVCSYLRVNLTWPILLIPKLEGITHVQKKPTISIQLDDFSRRGFEMIDAAAKKLRRGHDGLDIQVGTIPPIVNGKFRINGGTLVPYISGHIL